MVHIIRILPDMDIVGIAKLTMAMITNPTTDMATRAIKAATGAQLLQQTMRVAIGLVVTAGV